MKFRNDDPQQILYTELQWAKKGYIVSSGEKENGLELWPNRFCCRKVLYFRPDQVIKASTPEQRSELDKFLLPRKERAKKLKKMRQNEKKKELEAEKARRINCDKIEAGIKLCHAAAANAVPCYTKMLSIDIETTGLDYPWQDLSDEILQISIVGEAGNTLFNSYIKPYAHESWSEAQSINGITPEMVANAPYLHEVAAAIKSYIMNASEIIGYNLLSFDIPFIERWIGNLDCTGQITDVMLEFAPIYGEWSEEHCDYKYQKLTTCAEYFGIAFDAHNSLEDAIATMQCYKSLQHLKSPQPAEQSITKKAKHKQPTISCLQRR